MEKKDYMFNASSQKKRKRKAKGRKDGYEVLIVILRKNVAMHLGVGGGWGMVISLQMSTLSSLSGGPNLFLNQFLKVPGKKTFPPSSVGWDQAC